MLPVHAPHPIPRLHPTAPLPGDRHHSPDGKPSELFPNEIFQPLSPTIWGKKTQKTSSLKPQIFLSSDYFYSTPYTCKKKPLENPIFLQRGFSLLEKSVTTTYKAINNSFLVYLDGLLQIQGGRAVRKSSFLSPPSLISRASCKEEPPGRNGEQRERDFWDEGIIWRGQGSSSQL